MNRKFIYIKYLTIPNVMTGCSLAIGFITLLLIFNQKLTLALTFYALTILLDRLDGIAARKLQMVSDFGKEIDSLTDFFNFCIVPAIIGYFLGLNSILSVLILILYILAGECRLAHFNLEGMEEIDGKKYFSGIPTTLAASWFLILVSLLETLNLLYMKSILMMFFLILAILMDAPLRCHKNGILVKSLYIMLPIAVAILWIF